MKKQSLFIVLIIVVALMVGIWRDHHGKKAPLQSVNQSSQNTRLHTGTKLPQSKLLPPFELIDMNKKPFTNKMLKQHWTFLFFGYSACPSVCPLILNSLNQLALNLRGLPTLQFVFVSIDPNQDSPKRLKEYLKKANFKTAPLIGLTGEMAQIIQLAKAMGAYVEENPTATNEHISHSGTIFLINPEGKLTTIFTSGEKPSVIAQDFKEVVHQYTNGA